ncbi:transient receptor potential cation channel subfamily M member-like 2, partial [Symsagittifera roscoffensis]|uniref:transient receptor potential cation channel subfamily M member-like 2 n=1 Tax=Symsagittifera roscoffensis TaxID=84072 RepID=UPI00307C4B4D
MMLSLQLQTMTPSRRYKTTFGLIDQEKKMSFFERRHTRKFCVNFIPQEQGWRAGQGGKCKCGYSKQDHLPHSSANVWSNSQEWRRELHLETVDYGRRGFNCKLKFISQIDNYDHTADFTVIADDSHPEVAMEHLLLDWHLELPNIVISVAGSEKSLGMIARHATRFKTALLKTVCCTKCWVITGGTSNGVDKLVVDALREAQLLSWMGGDAPKFRIIGFANWNCVKGHEKLGQMVYVDPRVTGEYVVQKNSLTELEFEPSLNPMISHFLCIEGGLKGKKGQEVFVRSAVEETLAGAAEEEAVTGFSGYGIPTVLILLKGDFDVFERAANAVCKGIGIVICEGLGGATDILYYAFRMSSKNSPSVILSPIQQLKVMRLMEAMHKRKLLSNLYSKEPFEAARHMHMIYQCLRHKQLIFWYKTQRTEEPLDETIVRALLAGNAARKKDSLELALHWNRCDETVREMCEEQDMWSRTNADQLFTKALFEGKVDFVQVFLEYGFDIKHYLSAHRS